MSSPLLHDLADGALLVEYPGLSDEDANAQAVAGARLLERRPPEGFRSAVVGARTLFVEFDPARCGSARLSSLLTTRASSRPAEPRRRLRIPVLYGGEWGSDLEELAHDASLGAEDYARRHAGAVYRVAFLGFAPGFAYLTGLPPELQAPRLATPRTLVRAGTVAVAGPYSGIYPGGTPGGWRLIGWTHTRLFDPGADPPTLFQPGDQVRFEAVEEERHIPSWELSEAPSPEDRNGLAVLRVVSPGLFSSVQGEPRYGWSRYGVPPGGAMDPGALARANAVLGNRPDADGLEMTLVGPELEVLREATACLAGAAVDAQHRGQTIAPEQRFELRRGDVFKLGRIRNGARAYLAVAGGLAPAARFEISKRLAAGDLLFAAPRAVSPSLPSVATPFRRSATMGPLVVRVVLGSHRELFSREGLVTFLSSTYRVSAASDRRGIRLEGPAIVLAGEPDIPPEGTPLGGIQVPRDGLPIVLGPDRPVTGGYARIATVIGADFPALAQALPGEPVRFSEVSLAEALAVRVG